MQGWSWFSFVLSKEQFVCRGCHFKSLTGTNDDSAPSSGAVRTTRLKALGNLVPGCNKLTPDVGAIRSNGATCVDTTYCPADTLMWMRITLVEYTSGREVYEYSQPVPELQDLDYSVPNRRNVLSMITVAHSYAVPAEFLGFEIDEGAMPSSPSIELGIADQVDDVVSGDPSSSVQLPTIPEERPAEPPAARDGDELPPSERVIIAPRFSFH